MSTFYIYVRGKIRKSTDSTGGSIVSGWENPPKQGLKAVTFCNLSKQCRF